jgi:hypothetical protein
MTGALPEDAEDLAEITREKLLLRKPFSAQQLVEFIDSYFAEKRSRSLRS